VVLAAYGVKLGELTLPTSSEDYEQLLRGSKHFGVWSVFAMEPTGYASNRLLCSSAVSAPARWGLSHHRAESSS